MPVVARMESEALYTALRKGGADEALARQVVHEVATVADLEQLVTKADLQATKADLELAMADLELAMAKLSTDLTVRLGAIIVATVGVATTVLGFLLTRGAP